MTTAVTPNGIAYDREGPVGQTPVVLIHAGIADRRMWEPIWPWLSTRRDCVRLDLRGFGDSVLRPDGQLDPVDDVRGTLASLGIRRSHLVGASYGASVTVELALTDPERVSSLLLVAPGGSLIGAVTPDLQDFLDAERAALRDNDLDRAVAANVEWWVDRSSTRVGRASAHVRNLVARMQRRAFELAADWDDVEQAELDPPALERLGELACPVAVLVGGLDLTAIHVAARALAEGVQGSRLVEWPGVAHLPSLERPADFVRLLDDWLPTV